MNARPTPHIGVTLTTRRAIRAYAEAQREAIYHAERQAQPEPVQMCATVEDDEPLFTRAEVVIFALLGLASIGIYIAHSAGVL
jgi:hypothetical protein